MLLSNRVKQFPSCFVPSFPCKDKSLNLSFPQIMGTINLTPDSFHVASRCQEPAMAVRQAVAMVEQGAAIIDVGGEPTNPGMDNPVLPVETELARVIPVVKLLAREIDVPISVDTSSPQVMQAAVDAGASIINDVRALREPGALAVVARLQVPVVLMHMQYPRGVKQSTVPPLQDETVVAEVKQFLAQRLQACKEAGIASEQIILDPGVGGGNFGKTTKQNLLLLNHLEEFLTLGAPILLGASRKLFIGDVLDLPAEQRLTGSLAAAVIAASKGAAVIRVHDVRETVEAVKMAMAILEMA